MYLGLTFLLAAAAVLALQQLSQAADNAARYAVLRRLGAEEGMLSRSAVQQVALAFLLPLALALLHTVVGMKAANDLISTAAKVDTVHSALVTGGVLLAVYGGYFLATALACRRLALEGAPDGTAVLADCQTAGLADAGERGPRRRTTQKTGWPRLGPACLRCRWDQFQYSVLPLRPTVSALNTGLRPVFFCAV